MSARQKYGRQPKRLTDAQRIEIVERVRELIEYAHLFERDNRREAQTDLQFIAGDQWPDAVKAARGNDRPMLTVNQLPQFVRQVANPTRESDIAIKAVPVDDQSDPALARIYDGLIKQIEYQSNAKQVYVNANEHQAACGIGWFRVITQYVDDAVFDQEIRIKRVNNPLSVYCDPAAVEPDRSDASWMAVVEQWPRKTFEEKYPGKAPEGVDVPASGENVSGFFWSSADEVAIAEYYEKVPVTKTLALLSDGSTIDITDMPDAQIAIVHMQQQIVDVRDCASHRIDKYLVSGSDVLEGPIPWAGRYIPLIPVIGAETPLQRGVMRYGVVRFARDPQQIMNFYETAAAEAIALAPKAPYMVTPTQVGKHKAMWDTQNTTNRPYLFYNPDPLAPGPPKREHPPEPPQAFWAASANANENMKRVTGIYDASLGARSNETSGIAIGRREAQGETANSHFSDNLNTSLTHGGRVLIDLIPKIYDNQRVIRLLGPNGEDQSVAINRVLLGMDGMPIVENDLSTGRFDVRVTVGKNYITKRIEAMTMMLELAKSLPPDAQMLFLDLIVKNADFPGAEELARRFHNMVPPQALADPNDPSAPKPPSPMDDPTVVAQLEKLAAEIDKLKAEAAQVQATIGKTQADTLKTLAEADNLDAETDHQIIIPSITGKPHGGEAVGAKNGSAMSG